MQEYLNIFNLVFSNLNKIFYPRDIISIDLELSKSEIVLLMQLESSGELMMSKVSDSLNIPMSTATGIVERLVKNNYVVREKSENDRRIVVIRITDKGKNLVNKIRSIALGYIHDVCDQLSQEEIELIIKLINKVINVVEQKKSAENKNVAKEKTLRKIEIE